jgi:hypothetical protein
VRIHKTDIKDVKSLELNHIDLPESGKGRGIQESTNIVESHLHPGDKQNPNTPNLSQHDPWRRESQTHVIDLLSTLTNAGEHAVLRRPAAIDIFHLPARKVAAGIAWTAEIDEV